MLWSQVLRVGRVRPFTELIRWLMAAGCSDSCFYFKNNVWNKCHFFRFGHWTTPHLSLEAASMQTWCRSLSRAQTQWLALSLCDFQSQQQRVVRKNKQTSKLHLQAISQVNLRIQSLIESYWPSSNHLLLWLLLCCEFFGSRYVPHLAGLVLLLAKKEHRQCEQFIC